MQQVGNLERIYKHRPNFQFPNIAQVIHWNTIRFLIQSDTDYEPFLKKLANCCDMGDTVEEETVPPLFYQSPGSTILLLTWF